MNMDIELDRRSIQINNRRCNKGASDIEEFVRKARLRRQRANEAEPQEMIEERNVPEYSDKQVIGAMERIFIPPPGKMLPARIDTGAVTSSLDARNIERFERNGERWVRFSIMNPENGEYTTLERRIIRNVRIVQSFSDEAELGPVVELGVTIGRITQTAQFTLFDPTKSQAKGGAWKTI